MPIWVTRLPLPKKSRSPGSNWAVSLGDFDAQSGLLGGSPGEVQIKRCHDPFDQPTAVEREPRPDRTVLVLEAHLLPGQLHQRVPPGQHGSGERRERPIHRIHLCRQPPAGNWAEQECRCQEGEGGVESHQNR